LEEANTFFSADAEISLVYDSTPSMIAGITGLLISAALGITAVITVLFFFIRRMRWCLIAALSIPVSAAAGISVLAVMGRSLNSMSLGGLALGIGLVSDVSVIVLDLLNRSFEKTAGTNPCLQALLPPEDIHQKTSASSPARAIPSPEDISQKAASIAGSSAASTLTTALVFVPIAFLPGPLGDLFGDMAISLVAAILAGWLYAQFLLPSLYRMGIILNHNRSLRNEGSAPAEYKQARTLEKRYRKLLGSALRRPARVFAIAAAASIAGAALLLFRPFVFISPDAAEEVCISVVFPTGTLLESAVDIGKGISGLTAELPSVRTVYGKAGAEEEDTGRRADTDYRKEEFIFHCVLENGAKPEEALAEINSALLSFPGMPPFTVYFPLDKTEILLGLSRQDSFVISGKDREELAQRISLAENYLKEKEIAYSFLIPEQRPELRFFPNREAAAFLSIPTVNLAETLYILNEGVTASTLEIDGKPLNIVVSGTTMYAGGEPASFLEQIPLKTPQGKTVFLGSLGSIERRDADAALTRLERGDVSYITLQPNAGKHVAGVFSWFNQTGESVFSRYRNSLLLYVFLVLILLYMTMGAQFESFLLPLILMITIPFSLAGAGPALLITGAKLDSGAILGMAALFGLVVNNSLILFEISEEKIKNGHNAVSAVYLGASERLYAVLITTTTTVFALLPLILSPLGNTQRSMAAAMLGGLAASTLLSLFAIPPVLLRYFNRNLRITKPADEELRETRTSAKLHLTSGSEASALRRKT
jgi:multidrug efflux pump subunit AcrB